MTLDGYLDDASGTRLVLSSAADLDRVDEVRAGCDAILVGAGTVRADDPRLLVRDAHRRARRLAQGRPPSPHKVTVTRHPNLDPAAAFFRAGDATKLVYCASASVAPNRRRLGTLATVVDGGRNPTMGAVSEDLAAKGVHRLLVEGGQSVHTQFLSEGLGDELHVVIAPFFVGDSRAHRLVGDARFPFDRDRRAELTEVRRLDDVVLLRYALSPRFTVDGPDEWGGQR